MVKNGKHITNSSVLNARKPLINPRYYCFLLIKSSSSKELSIQSSRLNQPPLRALFLLGNSKSSLALTPKPWSKLRKKTSQPRVYCLKKESYWVGLATCGECELSSNLWLCLFCGHLGCGRKNFDGTGGNGHASEHYKNTGHTLVVKLGTITPDGNACKSQYSNF